MFTNSSIYTFMHSVKKKKKKEKIIKKEENQQSTVIVNLTFLDTCSADHDTF